MNKSQLIEALSSRFEGNKKAAKDALENVLDTITREVAKGEKVAITGFGAFERTIRPARMVRNPRTGERTRAKKTAVPKFRPGAELKAVVSGAKKLPRVSMSTAAKTTTTARKSAASSSRAKKTTAAKTATPAKSAAKSTATKGAAKTLAKKSSSAAAKKSAAKTLATKSPAKKATTAKKTSTKKASTSKTTPAKKSTTAKKTAKKS